MPADVKLTRPQVMGFVETLLMAPDARTDNRILTYIWALLGSGEAPMMDDLHSIRQGWSYHGSSIEDCRRRLLNLASLLSDVGSQLALEVLENRFTVKQASLPLKVEGEDG